MESDKNSKHSMDIDRVAMLARIHFSDGEKKELARNFDSILKFLGKLLEVNVDGVEPSAHAVPLYNVMRGDESGETLPRELALGNAPKKRDNQIIVPKVVE
ncbi:MAG: Asp-tRNA(Asn)/Glu-tRNA(Gln) amidotransferase subunit GatC [Puniceicoccales bacterium]|jgi:aspartyl-tRNA(Asn)/glutamyl-tRNA(Gln) amidotransferase subunit C|nr:Asp-tRNA(Asn)/Glu-tRNA(Gln) amidotransferase subunit GatC [Puniceicoccales bacterium]